MTSNPLRRLPKMDLLLARPSLADSPLPYAVKRAAARQVLEDCRRALLAGERADAPSPEEVEDAVLRLGLLHGDRLFRLLRLLRLADGLVQRAGEGVLRLDDHVLRPRRRGGAGAAVLHLRQDGLVADVGHGAALGAAQAVDLDDGGGAALLRHLHMLIVVKGPPLALEAGKFAPLIIRIGKIFLYFPLRPIVYLLKQHKPPANPCNIARVLL